MIERAGLAGVLALGLAACGGAAGGPASPTPTTASTPSCPAASAWDGTQCRVFAERISARAPTPFIENGRPVTLEVILYRPLGAGPFPTVMVHHGSTGNGDDPSLFTVTYTSENIARFFTERGWLVAFAQRRGRGASDGLYDEGSHRTAPDTPVSTRSRWQVSNARCPTSTPRLPTSRAGQTSTRRGF